jgi:hypothetical protein
MYKICFTRAAEKYLKNLKEKGEISNSDTKSNKNFVSEFFLYKSNNFRINGNNIIRREVNKQQIKPWKFLEKNNHYYNI